MTEKLKSEFKRIRDDALISENDLINYPLADNTPVLPLPAPSPVPDPVMNYVGNSHA